ncbi:uncharacterized protein C4orf51 homolog isoform 1-T1 [Liasis olivaceus]
MAKYLFLAPRLPVPFSPLSSEAFEEIKCLAGKAWVQHSQEYVDCPTSYAAAFGNKGLDVSRRAQVTPSSPTRVHRPHPPKVFLVNQLHNLPGHYGNGKGIHPNWVEHSSDMKKFQVHPEKIKHNAVAAASPLAPLGAIEQRINSPSLKGSQTGDKNFISSLCSQDVLTGWPVTGKT